jgi:hypothetical protein
VIAGRVAKDVGVRGVLGGNMGFGVCVMGGLGGGGLGSRVRFAIVETGSLPGRQILLNFRSWIRHFCSWLFGAREFSAGIHVFLGGLCGLGGLEL